MKLTLILFSFGLVTVCTQQPDCTKDWFKNVHVLTREDFKVDASAVYKASVSNLRTERAIMVLNEHIPILCEGAIQNLPNLEKLQLSLLALQELSPNSLLNLPNLKHVRYIRYNQIEEIYEGVFNNLPLVILDLEGNGINYINENAFDDMSNLKELYLGKNNIKRINKNWFFNSPNLHKVFLEENAISKLPKKAFKQLEPHRQLSVNLSGNQIEEIFPRAFGNFKKFGHFDLSDNKISALPGNLFGINRIGGKYELDLRNNNINCLEKNIYAEVFSNCKRVLMQGNPITCDCSNTIERFFAKRGNGVEIFYEIDQNCQRRNK